MIRRVVVHHVGMVSIPQVNPEPTRPRLRQCSVQHGNGRIVGLDHSRLEDLAVHLFDDRLQQFGRNRHPVAHRLTRQLHAVTAENSFLAIERKMIRIFADNHLGQQPWSGQPLLDRLGEPLGNDHIGLARLTGVFGPHILDHDQAGRNVIELLADLLADLGADDTAVGTR